MLAVGLTACHVFSLLLAVPPAHECKAWAYFNAVRLALTFQRHYSSRGLDPCSLLPNAFSEYDQSVKPNTTLISE